MATNWKKRHEGHYSKMIDPEGDMQVNVIELTDYNGNRVATVCCTGYPIMTINLDPEIGGHQFLTPCGYFDGQAQSMIAFQDVIEGIDEDAHQAYLVDVDEATGWELFTACFEASGDGHETCGFVEQITELLNNDYNVRTDGGQYADSLHD